MILGKGENVPLLQGPFPRPGFSRYHVGAAASLCGELNRIVLLAAEITTFVLEYKTIKINK